jgi:hypothetical protein
MARSIDFTNLDEDDLRYLADRQWLVNEGDAQGHETSKAVAAWREDGTVPEPAEDDDEDGIEYSEATVDQLRAELERRELDTTGKKAELIARLEADDEEDDDEIDDTPQS